jgi:replicative DNA helicase
MNLPSNVDAERLVLGSIILEDGLFLQAASQLEAGDFSLEKHRRIFKRMGELRERGDKIDRITVANELMKFNELESCDGLTYLVSLDDGLPRVQNIDSYVNIVKQEAGRRRIVYAAQGIMNKAMLREKTPEQLIADATTTLRDLYQEKTEKPETAEEIIAAAGGIDAFFRKAPGIPAPWRNLNTATGGWKPGSLIIVAARPSMGKTSFAMNAAWGVATRNVPTNFYSAEMDAQELIYRQLAFLSGIPYDDVSSGQHSKAERAELNHALAEITSRPLRIIESSGQNVMAIRSHAERTKERHGLGFLVFDYLGMFRVDEKNRTHELGSITREFKLMARSLGIPVMLLVQLNREAEKRSDHRPQLSDLRDSGEIEEHADLVMLLHRPGYYLKDQPELKLSAEVNIAKQRNGATPVLDLLYRGERFRFEQEEFREPQ